MERHSSHFIQQKLEAMKDTSDAIKDNALTPNSLLHVKTTLSAASKFWDLIERFASKGMKL
jgi:hypothetical protein